jgi:SAM-dependent methyltransferase
MSPDPTLADALAALHRGDRDAAAAIASAAANRDTQLGPALATYLGHDEQNSVYSAPAAFEAFIRGGDNIGLYATVSATLADLYGRRSVDSLVDIGCGDGGALVPALRQAEPAPARVDLVEPSPALLTVAQADAASAVGDRVELHTWPSSVQDFLTSAAERQAHWDMAESTFALHTLPTDERTEVLAALREHIEFLAIVEFDVPAAPIGSPAYLQFLADSYEIGLSEYADDGGLVAQLAPGAVRVTFEQPATEWVAQLERAGYHSVTAAPLYPYWSSPAFLLTASS